MDEGTAQRPPTPSGVKAPQEARQRAVDALCEHFAADTIDLNEFERRVEAAHKAETLEELRALLSDLGAPGSELTRRPATRGNVPVVQQERRVPIARPELVKDNQYVVGIFGGPSRKGSWIPARHVWSIAVMGGVELDFREASLGPGVTEVSVFALWGGVEIIVPPDVQVDFGGMGFMGAFDCAGDIRAVFDPDAPILRINGLAIMGGAEVTVRRPGESKREARRRRKLEKKARKQARLGPGGSGRKK